MVRKKIISLILTVGVVGGMCTYAINYYNSSIQNIKVVAYKASAQTNEKGFQIDKYQSIESVAWISDNEVLTLTKKGEFKNPDSTTPIYFCSIYNLNTESSKDFKDVNIDEFMGVSPDKKYVIYAETRIIPKGGSEQWQKAVDSGDIFHKNVKLLNLSTGEISNAYTEKLNCNAQYLWVSNNKILVNYLHKWEIIDTTGKVYLKGSYNVGKFDGAAYISGFDDIKDLGTRVEGKFYYTQNIYGKQEVTICTMDVVTKEIKSIFSNNQYSLMADKKGKTIIIDNDFINNGEISSHAVTIMDESGKQLKNIKLTKDRGDNTYVLSPDGSKAAYLGYSNVDTDFDPSIKIIDAKTGAIKEIVKVSSLKDKDEKIDYETFEINDKDGKVKQIKRPIIPTISNICWDNTSAALSFTYGKSSAFNSVISSKTNTYIVSLNK